jgi:two-component sensor histidine kinase
MRDELGYRLHQQAILARLGLAALKGGTLDELLQDAVLLTAEGVRDRFCKVLEYDAHSHRFLVREGVGWESGVVRVATVGADLESPAGYAFRTGQPVIANQLSHEDRFRTPELLVRHGIRRAANVIIKGQGQPFGVLEVDSQLEGRFEEQDLDFLQAMANVVGVAVERKRLEDRQELLKGELTHRIKNILTTVQAIAVLTLRKTQETAQFLDRLHALSRVHDLLAGESWQGSTLREVVAETLAPYGVGTRISIHGPDVRIPSNDAAMLGMVFIELATNAAKYGALSLDQGAVVISWEINSSDLGPQIDVVWREQDGPRISKPRRKGFGSRLLQQSASASLGAEIKLEFPPAGVECRIHLPARCNWPLGVP